MEDTQRAMEAWRDCADARAQEIVLLRRELLNLYDLVSQYHNAMAKLVITRYYDKQPAASSNTIPLNALHPKGDGVPR